MGVFRDIGNKIQLYNPLTGEAFFSYDKQNDKLDAEGKDLDNVGSLSTDEIDSKDATIRNSKYIRENVEDGSTAVIQEVKDSGGTVTQDSRTQMTNNVDTNATTILTVDNEPIALLCVVYGKDGSSNRFNDLVFATRNSPPDVISSNDDLGTPASRTYSNDGDEIQLAMGSGTYTVGVSGYGVSP
ncbi:hypothetical protein EXE43_20090 [Halorubrum sp. SS5]|nr:MULTISPECIES: hypothetical protein [unclassified Halorubrum]TKX52881.1 hypothetical protein EXE42_15125 [Halorubrum sp. SP3]TKX58893.1 hypothetical protein EXE44_04940 [Halorubrum sp. SS7]TKX84219.1 hypothetical protein EXE43_20090 [Halorubrum sp. SS5]